MTEQTNELNEPPSETLEGSVPAMATPAERNAALDQAFDYRGDVTIHTADGAVTEGYIFDRRGDAPNPYVRVMPTNSQDRCKVRYADIARLQFTGRDTAAGKSWETWVKNYEEKRARGEKASLEPDSLD